MSLADMEAALGDQDAGERRESDPVLQILPPETSFSRHEAGTVNLFLLF